MIPIFILEPNQNQARPDQTQNGFDSSKMIWFQTNCILASTDLSVIKSPGKIKAKFLNISESRSGCQTPSLNFSYFSHFGGNFNILGIKKQVLELKNTLVSLAEAVGLQKGKAQKREAEGLQRGLNAPPQSSARSRLFVAPCQNILVFRFILKYLIVDYGILGYLIVYCGILWYIILL